MEFILLKNLDEWEKFKSSNNTKETVIFKFSPKCSISLAAEKEFSNWLEALDENTNLNVFKVDVLNSKPLSQSLANEFNIKHESPQIIWLDKKGKVKWDTSHHSITKDALNEKLRSEKVGFLRKIF